MEPLDWYARGTVEVQANHKRRFTQQISDPITGTCTPSWCSRAASASKTIYLLLPVCSPLSFDAASSRAAISSMRANCHGQRTLYRKGRWSKRLSSGEYSSAWYAGVSVVALCRLME